jgi:hypothetical protein
VEWVVGEWTTEYELPQDVPGFGTKGDMVHVSQLREWNQNRDAIQTEAIVTVNGKTLGGSKGLTSWDAAKGQKVAKSGAAR